MADQVSWHLSGDYFENCSCSIVCPCLVSAAAPLTARPTEGFCNVPLIFHVESGRYGDIALDGLNVFVILRAPGVMADGDWSIAAYIDQRADDKQTEALAAIFTGAAGGPMAAFTPLISENLGVKKVPITFRIEGKTRSAEIPGILHVGRSLADPASQRGNLGEHRPSRQPRQDGDGRRRARQHLQRSWHALGQFRQERPLCADPLVEPGVRQA
jgi:hypothetical protein